ncbi:hypothetical protein REPUB_Repub11eG0087600 [Reevesia pubescens]
MASLSSAPNNGILEGHATNRHPVFDGTNYQLWSTKIAVYIQACDMDMWDIIMKGFFIPTKKNEANEVVSKSKSECTTDDKTKVSSIEDKLIHISDISEDDDELALAVRRFNRLLLKRNPSYERRLRRRDFN